jgi:hypothetical protein
MTEETPLQAAYRTYEAAMALLDAAKEALVRHFEANPDGGTDSRVRHLQGEIEMAQRRVALSEARIVALRRLAEAEAQAVEDAAQAAQDGEEEARRKFREDCLRLLPERQVAAADAMVEFVLAAIGSGTVAPGFAQSPASWTAMLARAVGVDVGQVALEHVRARSLGA